MAPFFVEPPADFDPFVESRMSLRILVSNFMIGIRLYRPQKCGPGMDVALYLGGDKMKKPANMNALILCLMAGAITICWFLLAADLLAQNNYAVGGFLDEDGDGFNDLLPDSDGDGVPDLLDPDSKIDLSDSTYMHRFMRMHEMQQHMRWEYMDGFMSGGHMGHGEPGMFGPGDSTMHGGHQGGGGHHGGGMGPDPDGGGMNPGQGGGKIPGAGEFQSAGPGQAAPDPKSQQPAQPNQTDNDKNPRPDDAAKKPVPANR